MSWPRRWTVALITAAFGLSVPGSAFAGSVPAGFRAATLSARSAGEWWIGGSIPCRFKHPCLALVRTLNGGRSFARVALPTLVDVEGNYGAQIHFADADDGYLAGTRFWVTHDGGTHWRMLDLGGEVQSVDTGGGFVYATVLEKTRGFLVRSTVGNDDWVVLAEARYGFHGVTVDGGVVLLDQNVNDGGEQRILISHDQGAHFTFSKSLEEIVCGPDEPVSGTVWMLCSGGMTDLLYRSTDGGQQFTQPDWNGSPADPPKLLGLPNFATLGAATATTAVIGSQRLLRTTNGGRSFKRVPVPLADGGWRDITFFDATHGVALGLFGQTANPPGRLYYTSDGGATYRLVSIR